MQAIQYLKSIPRYLLTRGLGRRWPALYTGPTACIALRDVPEPRLPTPRWVKVHTHLSGICGSDLATVTAQGSPYFSPFISCPFVLGHENVGEVVEMGPEADGCAVGDRLVIAPALCCAVRGIAEECRSCRTGHFANCENILHGDLSAGIQTGYCRDTGGGWSPFFVAHPFQIHRLPDDLPDHVAVLAEPLACALHGVLAVAPEDGATVLVLGCGTMGLLTIAALRTLGHRCRILAVAKYPHQQELARKLGADELLRPGRGLYEDFCAQTGATSHRPELGKPVLLGGVEVAFDCVGSATTIDDALRFTRPRGTICLAGMPAIPKNVDWTSLWYKELRVQGSYAYGWETVNGERVRTFDLALRLLRQRATELAPMVGATFPLSEYRQALACALHTGRSRVIKTVFAMA